MLKRKQIVPLVLTAATLMAASAVHAQKGGANNSSLYRWVDESGQVHYGDKVPPQESKQGRETLSKNGTVTKVVPRELRGAELEQAQARLAAEKVAEEEHQQRITYDRYLLQSFASVADLQAAREERLGALDGRITLAQKSVQDNEKTLADLRERAGSKPPTGTLKTQIETFESSLIDGLQALRKLRDERTATEQKYSSDIERFKGLRSGSIKQGS